MPHAAIRARAADSERKGAQLQRTNSQSIYIYTYIYIQDVHLADLCGDALVAAILMLNASAWEHVMGAINHTLV